MTKRLLLICNTLEREVSQLVAGGGYGEVEVLAYPAVCGSDEAERKALERVLDQAVDGQAEPCLLGCCTLERLVECEGRADRLPVAATTRCMDMLLDPDLVALLAEQGAYLVTPGWLSAWRRRLERWGLDKATAPGFFAQVARKIVLLDTGSSAAAGDQLAELAAFAKLPAERLEVGVAELARFVARALAGGENAGGEPAGTADASSSASALHAVAARLLLALTRAQGADQVAAAVLSCFADLCRPSRMLLVPAGDVAPWVWPAGTSVDTDMLARAAEQDDQLAAMVGDTGLLLRFAQQEHTAAVLVVDGVAQPAHRGEQLAIARELVAPCAVAFAAASDGSTSAEP